MTTSPSDPEALQRQARALRDRSATVILATASPDGRPEASQAPWVADEQERPCIFISQLATHTRNLLANPRASLLFVEEESQSRNLHARERLVLQCRAEEMHGEAAGRLLDEMESAFGETVALLRSLPDFHLFRFRVEEGVYVRGFGQAWRVEGNELSISLPPSPRPSPPRGGRERT
jgi:putative heme iron utilization protein